MKRRGGSIKTTTHSVTQGIPIGRVVEVATAEKNLSDARGGVGEKQVRSVVLEALKGEERLAVASSTERTYAAAPPVDVRRNSPS